MREVATGLSRVSSRHADRRPCADQTPYPWKFCQSMRAALGEVNDASASISHNPIYHPTLPV